MDIVEDNGFQRLVRLLMRYNIIDKRRRESLQYSIKTMMRSLSRIYGSLELKEALYEQFITPPVVLIHNKTIFVKE